MSRTDIYVQIRETEALIQGLDDKTLVELARHLRYRPSGYQFDPAFVHHRWDGWVNLFEMEGRFPVGLVNRVEQFLIRKNMRHRVEDISRHTEGEQIITALNREIESRWYQDDAVAAALSAQRGMGIVRAPTGAGKTVILARLIHEVGQASVVLVPTIDLLFQTRKFLEWAFGQSIGQLGGGVVDPRPITVATIRTMAKVLNLRYVKYKLDDVDDSDDTIVDTTGLADWVKSIGMLIVDECHIVAADSAYEIATTIRCPRKIGMSASPWRDDNADLKIEAALGQVIYRIEVPPLVKGGYLVPAIFRSIKTQPPELPAPEDLWTTKYASAYSFLVKNKHRNQVIADTTNELIDEGRTVLVLVRHLAHGEALRRLIPKSTYIAGSSPGWVMAFHESGDRARIIQQMRDREISCIIATTIADMGLDIPALDTLVLAGGGKSSTRHLQRIGRVCRPYPNKGSGLIIDFDDAWAHMKRSENQDPNRTKFDPKWIYRPGWFLEHAKARRKIEREEWSGAAIWL